MQVISEAEGVAITAVYLRLCAHANDFEYFARGRQTLMFSWRGRNKGWTEERRSPEEDIGLEIVSGSIYLIILELSEIVRKKGAILHCIIVVVACCVIY